jgi:hypothetical protein
MIFRFARGLGRLTAAAIVAGASVGLLGAPAFAAHPVESHPGAAHQDSRTPKPRIGLSGLAFAQRDVDATTGSAVVPLEWTVTDTTAGATGVSGDLDIRMKSNGGGYLGRAIHVEYAYGNSGYGRADFVGGTPERATFRYQLVVPRYAGKTAATWVVSRFNGQNAQGTRLTLDGADLRHFAASLVAKEAVDTTKPVHGYINLEAQGAQHPYGYVNGTMASALYSFDVQDWESGFWRGSLQMRGPTGKKINVDFSVERTRTPPH